MLMEADTGARPAAPPASFAALLDRRPNLFLPVWIAVYFAALWPFLRRPLWYDELFTYYVATAPSWQRFLGGVLHVDLNPPLNALLVRASVFLFGDSPLTVRLPSFLGYLGASLVLFYLVRRRMGGVLGLASISILWSFSFSPYAAEARPYGVLLFFFSLASWFWLNAAGRDRWTKSHAGLTASIVAMLMTHCFSPVFVAAVGAGELTRTITTGRIDKRIWASLLSPLILVVLYIPLIRNAQALDMPHSFEANFATIPLFYMRVFLPILPAIGAILLLWLFAEKSRPSVPWRDLLRPHESAFCVASLLAPLAIIGYSLRSGVAFWDRYGIGAALGGSLLLTALLAYCVRGNLNRAAAVSAISLLVFCFTKAGASASLANFEGSSTSVRAVRPDLPFVAACGLTFLEMDHNEPLDFSPRLYYLTDKESAFGYAHATAFESFPTLKERWPIRANVQAYREFVQRHREFLVLATYDCPLEWLLKKLHDDGATIQLVQSGQTGYRDHDLFDVRFP
ncbi:MAG TPA: glycosyltransferase family 39 protein [Bryobacteraceae bacterium]|nr:glycosyltransferase family 39 protein [Bryobacteraceae bacterium]